MNCSAGQKRIPFDTSKARIHYSVPTTYTYALRQHFVLLKQPAPMKKTLSTLHNSHIVEDQRIINVWEQKLSFSPFIRLLSCSTSHVLRFYTKFSEMYHWPFYPSQTKLKALKTFFYLPCHHFLFSFLPSYFAFIIFTIVFCRWKPFKHSLECL